MTRSDHSMRRVENGVVVNLVSLQPAVDEWQISWVDGHSWSAQVMCLDDLAAVGDLLTGYAARMRQTGGEPAAGPRLPGF